MISPPTTSSASMMSAAVKGQSVAEARRLIRAFKALMSIHESKLEGESDGEEHRRLREQLVSGGEPDADLVGLAAELDARATSEGIDERTAEQLLLGLRARRIKRELSDADPARTMELQASLAKILATVEELAAAQAFSDRASQRARARALWALGPRETASGRASRASRASRRPRRR